VSLDSILEFREKFKPMLRSILLLILGFLLAYDIYTYTTLIQYEEVPKEVMAEVERTNQLEYPSYIVFNDTILNNMEYDNINRVNVYNVDFDNSTKRDNKLLSIMLDLFVITLLWRKNEH
jgi:uncharacterized membrane protein